MCDFVVGCLEVEVLSSFASNLMPCFELSLLLICELFLMPCRQQGGELYCSIYSSNITLLVVTWDVTKFCL